MKLVNRCVLENSYTKHVGQDPHPNQVILAVTIVSWMHLISVYPLNKKFNYFFTGIIEGIGVCFVFQESSIKGGLQDRRVVACEILVYDKFDFITVVVSAHKQCNHSFRRTIKHSLASKQWKLEKRLNSHLNSVLLYRPQIGYSNHKVGLSRADRGCLFRYCRNQAPQIRDIGETECRWRYCRAISHPLTKIVVREGSPGLLFECNPS